MTCLENINYCIEKSLRGCALLSFTSTSIFLALHYKANINIHMFKYSFVIFLITLSTCLCQLYTKSQLTTVDNSEREHHNTNTIIINHENTNKERKENIPHSIATVIASESDNDDHEVYKL